MWGSDGTVEATTAMLYSASHSPCFGRYVLYVYSELSLPVKGGISNTVLYIIIIVYGELYACIIGPLGCV